MGLVSNPVQLGFALVNQLGGAVLWSWVELRDCNVALLLRRLRAVALNNGSVVWIHLVDHAAMKLLEEQDSVHSEGRRRAAVLSCKGSSQAA